MDLPLSQHQAVMAANWMELNFGDKIKAATSNSKFTPDIIIAIALQESAIDWIGWIKKYTPAQILALCISDPTGDQPDTVRNVFPKDLAHFKLVYPDLADMLVAEGNKYRAAKGWSPRQWLCKAYGIFQYDIQAITTDKDFFANKRWYDFDYCLNRLMQELHTKIEMTGDVWGAIKHYNGSGAAADAYMLNVKQFHDWITT